MKGDTEAALFELGLVTLEHRRYAPYEFACRTGDLFFLVCVACLPLRLDLLVQVPEEVVLAHVAPFFPLALAGPVPASRRVLETGRIVDVHAFDCLPRGSVASLHCKCSTMANSTRVSSLLTSSCPRRKPRSPFCTSGSGCASRLRCRERESVSCAIGTR